jgi:hypothetical protein
MESRFRLSFLKPQLICTGQRHVGDTARACTTTARRVALAGKSVEGGREGRERAKPARPGSGRAGTRGLACDYFVNNACQPRAHAATLYTKMPDTLLGTELVSIWLHRGQREKENKLWECKGPRRGRERVCDRRCARVGMYVLSITARGYAPMAIHARARARAYRSPRPTHKSDVSADGICRYGRCLSFSLSSLPPRSLSLSLSVLAERRAKVEREKFRAFRETDFIRGCALTRAADTPSNGRKLSETRRNPAISRYTPSVLPNFCAASLSRPCKLSRGRTKRSRRIS